MGQQLRSMMERQAAASRASSAEFGVEEVQSYKAAQAQAQAQTQTQADVTIGTDADAGAVSAGTALGTHLVATKETLASLAPRPQRPIPAFLAAQFRLLSALEDMQPRTQNFFCSPVSLQSVLCAAALAATPGSETARQLLTLFGRSSSASASSCATTDDALMAMHASGMLDSRIPNLTVANALFIVDGDVKNEFAATLQMSMGAQALQARRAADVNAWCDAHTLGAIPAIVTDDMVTPDTAMLLVNAVLFRGKWQFPFDSYNTIELNEWKTGDGGNDGGSSGSGSGSGSGFGSGSGSGATTRAHFMRKTFEKREERLYAGFIGEGTPVHARVVRVPYRVERDDDGGFASAFPSVASQSASAAPGRMEAWFVLPEESGDAALARVCDALPQLWPEISALSDSSENLRVVQLTCPRFKIDSGRMNVVPALKDMGVLAPFKPEDGIDGGGFSTATPRDDAYIGTVLQRATCAVDEEGTVAAAVSVASIVYEGFNPYGREEKPKPFVMTLTRPFYMFVVMAAASGDDGLRRIVNVPVFAGRIYKPSTSE